MNRMYRLAIVGFVLIFLSACAEASVDSSGKRMLITVTNNAEVEFYGIEIEILNHTQGVANADGSKIAKGDTLTFEFLEDDFPLEGGAEMKVHLLTDSGDRIPINEKLPLKLANDEYNLELTGSRGTDLVLHFFEP